MVPLKHIQQPPLLSKSSQSSDSQSSSNDKTSSLTSLSSEDDKEEVKEEDYLQINGNRVNVEDYNAQKSCNSRRNSNDNNNNAIPRISCPESWLSRNPVRVLLVLLMFCFVAVAFAQGCNIRIPGACARAEHCGCAALPGACLSTGSLPTLLTLKLNQKA